MAYDPSKPIKRLKYFTGQFLEDIDFTDEQEYHIGMRWRGKRALYYRPGVLEGIDVEPKEGDAGKIVITSGMAVDTQGRELVVTIPITKSLLPGSSVLLVTLKYHDRPSDEQTPDSDYSDYTRMTEEPECSFVADGQLVDAEAIVIAKINVVNGMLSGNPDFSLRQYADARFPHNLTVGQGGNGVLKTHYIDGKNNVLGPTVDDNDHLYINWKTGKDVYLGFGEGTKSSLFVSGNAVIGTGTASENHKLVIRGPNSPGDASGHQDLSYEFDAAGSAKIRAYRGGSWDTYLQFLTNAAGTGSDNPQVRLHIDEKGYVGIGTNEPKAKLEVVSNSGHGVMISTTGSDKAMAILTNSNISYTNGRAMKKVLGGGEFKLNCSAATLLGKIYYEGPYVNSNRIGCSFHTVSQFQIYTNFNLPLNAVINSVRIRVSHSGSGTGGLICNVALQKILQTVNGWSAFPVIAGGGGGFNLALATGGASENFSPPLTTTVMNRTVNSNEENFAIEINSLPTSAGGYIYLEWMEINYTLYDLLNW